MLQHKLNVKLSQRQILTPGLVQMVSVLALNKIELKDMINAEMVENPVLEELEDSVPLIDDVGRREEERDRVAATATSEEAPVPADEKKDPFEEIDFGSFFQEYLDPGYRSSGRNGRHRAAVVRELPLQARQPDRSPDVATGRDLGEPAVHEAAELIIGNLNEDGYLIASDEELMGVAPPAAPEVDAAAQEASEGSCRRLGLAADGRPRARSETPEIDPDLAPDWSASVNASTKSAAYRWPPRSRPLTNWRAETVPGCSRRRYRAPAARFNPGFTFADLHEALERCSPVRSSGRRLPRPARVPAPPAALSSSNCMPASPTTAMAMRKLVADAIAVVDQHLRAVQLKQFKEIAQGHRASGRSRAGGA